MRVHHLNGISTCPLGGRLMDARSPSMLQRGQLCCHCLLLETDRGLVLVDTGLGLRDVEDPRARLSAFFLFLLAPDFRAEMTIVHQIRQMGFDSRDVRHVVLSHLDFDHAGGLDDFPQATVHLLEVERASASAQRTWLDRQRYRPPQWSTSHQWNTYPSGLGEPWFGFSAVRGLEGVSDEVLLVPLPGHTLGHAGVAVRREEGWLLLAADAYFHREEMSLDRPRCTPGLDMYQRLMEKDRNDRLENQRRLRELRRAHGSEVEIICSHDPVEFERLAGRRAGVPAEAIRGRDGRGHLEVVSANPPV